jgi:hypothetical protein
MRRTNTTRTAEPRTQVSGGKAQTTRPRRIRCVTHVGHPGCYTTRLVICIRNPCYEKNRIPYPQPPSRVASINKIAAPVTKRHSLLRIRFIPVLSRSAQGLGRLARRRPIPFLCHRGRRVGMRVLAGHTKSAINRPGRDFDAACRWFASFTLLSLLPPSGAGRIR